jgi:UDP-2,4-diacetamido-2,4,6-trideoxy-beta-L-altropyranose hydrolase
MDETLLIRADASSQIGTGHVMRCLALAQAWQDAGGQVVFALATKSLLLEARLQAEGIEVTYLSVLPGGIDDAIQTMDLAQERSADWVVLDGYHFGAHYQRIVTDGPCLLVLDDYGHAEHYYADMVLNQNLYANENFYPHREPHTRLLLGTHYALLRREFLKWRGWRREIPEVARKLLITLGGSDPNNMTGKVIQALPEMEIAGLEVKIVVGPANPHLATLQRAARVSKINLQFLTAVKDMPGLMAWAEVAVSGGGTTCWELAFMGVPSLVLVLAQNQLGNAEGLGQGGVAINFGRLDQSSESGLAKTLQDLCQAGERRSHMSRLGRQLVDGAGTSRVVQSLDVGHGLRKKDDADSVIRQ